MFQVNGKISKTIDIQDRSVQYGDGVFETIAVYDKKPEFWIDHFKRLKKGCKILKIKCPSEKFLKKEIKKFFTKLKLKKFILKIIISRGKGGRGYKLPETMKPVRILGMYKWPNYPKKNISEGVNLNICKTKLSQQPSLSGIKHLNKLEQIIARSEWTNKFISESIMLDNKNNVVEGTMSNIFGIKNNNFIVPEIKFAGIHGIMRKIIIDILKRKKEKYLIKEINIQSFLKMDEIFICNSIFGVWPVIKIKNKKFLFGQKTKHIIELVNIERNKQNSF